MRRLLPPLLFVSTAAACAAVLGIDERPLRPDAVAEDGGADTGPVDPCAHTAAPPPPDKDDATESIPPFYVAVRSLTFLGEKTRSAGFDLDHVCTCDTRTGAASGGGSTCRAASSACDEEGGVDNRAAAFFDSFVDAVNFDDIAAVGSEADMGHRATLLHIAEYNGTANDTEVRIGIMTSRGILDGSGCGTTVDDAGDTSPPRVTAGWCGRDKWTYQSASVIPQSKVPIVRVKGWVKDGRLTFQSEAPISLFVSNATVSITKPIGTGELTKGPDGIWRLDDAVLAGTMPIHDLLVALGTSPGEKRPDGGRGQFCERAVYGTIKGTVCQQPDMLAEGPSDPAKTCDAVSTAVTFAAEQADVGDEFTPLPEDAPCAPDQVDAGLYRCP